MDDITPPTITCPGDLSFECIGDVPAANIALVTASDNCGVPVVTWEGDVWAGTCPRIITRTYMAEDSCGNTTTCVQLITVDDITPPTITCPGDLSFECIGDVPAANIALVTASDNCGVPVVTWEGDVWAGTCPRIITRTYMAEDSCGNTTTCVQLITVDDITPPTITCPGDLSFECIGDVPAANIALVTASDNCGVPVVTWEGDVWAGTCPRIITRTYMAEDSCGNTTTCVQLITVDDITPPTITCPGDLSFECIGDVPAANIALVTASDNCGVPVVTWEGDVWAGTCPRIITRTYMAEDSCGNTTTCVQLITVDDITPPTITCPGDLSFECIGDVPAANIALVTASDNCGVPVVTWEGDVWAGTCPRIITRTYMAEDSCGNTTTCVQLITVDDITPPTITCPGDLSFECIGDVPAANIALVTASDNCGVPVVTWEGDVWAGTCPRIITRTYMAEDSCGNTTTCVQLITVDDITPPTITCPGDLSFECIGDVPAANIALVTASDNCGVPVVTWEGDVWAGTCPRIITRTYMAEDSCGNTTTCVQLITVDDITPPTITCPGDLSFECIGDVPAANIALVTASDNCGVPVVTWEGDVWAGTCPRIITRTYMAEDSCGNTTTCVQLITVDDITPPTITCPGDLSFECIGDVPAANIALVTASDNCGVPVVTWEGDVWAGTCPRIITRTYMAEDSCGNTTTCVQLITVDDITPPTITCPGDLSFECIGDVPAANIALVTASDNCGVPVVTWEGDVWAGTCPRIITRTYMAEDSCGNTTTCVQLITVDDITPPTITCPGDLSFECIGDVPAANIALVTASDNCGVPVVTWEGDVWAGTCPRIITRTYMAEDSCGNTTTCVQLITVDDITPPTITCPGDLSFECIGDVPAANIALVTASDNCGVPVVTWEGDVWAGTCPRIITRTYMAEDSCGNTTTCVQLITVDDITPPTITCPGDLSFECIGDVPAANIALVTASDNCGVPVVTWEGDVWAGTCPRIITRTYMAEDSCGNTTTCVQLITVDDITPPTITCPGDLSFECIGDVPAANIALVTASDNCGVPVVTWEGDVWAGTCPRIITRTYMAEDSCGNTTTCVQLITVDDITPPTITCPGDLSFECIGDVPAANIALVTASDNCGVPVVTWEGDVWAGTCPRIITRTYMAEDSCGNTTTCVQLITVDDITPPTITCPGDLSFECIGDVPAANIALVTASDNCGVPVVTWEGDVWAGTCPRIITRTYMAEDSCGNTTTCVQLITVDDITPPTITCPGDLSFECIGDVPAANIALVTASDNCGVPVVTWEGDVWAGTCPRIITRTYMAEDSCGNTTTCVQLITVDDITPPTITCPGDLSFECIGDVPAANIALVTASDNCGVPVVTWEGDVWAGTCPRIITRTYMAEDSCGNTTTCVQLITVDDITPPTITCPGDLSFECIGDVPAANIALVTASDNCGVPVVTWEGDVWAGTCPRIITRTYMAEDSCGNTTTCVQLITVDDITPPTITCPGDLSFECIGDVPAANIALVTASDNCGVPVVTWEGDVWAGTCPRIITRTYMAEDSCGNTTTCVQLITVDDITPPTITCPGDLSFCIYHRCSGLHDHTEFLVSAAQRWITAALMTRRSIF